MPLILETRQADGTTVRVSLRAGVNRIPFDGGSTYRIFEDRSGLTPAGLVVRRVDNDLVVEHLRITRGGEEASVQLPDYYTHCGSSNSCPVTIETAGGMPVKVDASTPLIGALSDGSFVVYDPDFVPSSLSGAGDTFQIRPILYGAGGLAIAGLAVAGGGGGGDSRTAVSATGGQPPADNTLKITSLPFVNTRFPAITGEGEPGARILVQVDTDGDGRAEVGYTTIVQTDSRWSVNLATATPTQG